MFAYFSVFSVWCLLLVSFLAVDSGAITELVSHNLAKVYLQRLADYYCGLVLNVCGTPCSDMLLL